MKEKNKKMKCVACGSEIADKSKFCPECGAKVDIVEFPKILQLKCQSCGGVMNVTEDSPVLFCQFCGSKELIHESDDVTIQRIKSKTFKEVEIEKLKHEERKENRQEEKEKKQAAEKELKTFKKSKLSKIVFVLFIVCLLVAWNAFAKKNYIPGIIAGVQTVLFALSWLTGMQFVYKKRHNIHVLFAVIGFVFIFIYFKVNSGLNDSHNETYVETYVWPTSGITTVLPQPKSNKGNIIDSKDFFSVDVYKTSEEDFQAYIEACIENGFIIDAERDSMSYNAYNEEGYKLGILYFKSDQDMQVYLDAPKAVGEFKWPTSAIASLMPVPQSNIGKVEWEADYGFVIYVGNTTVDDFNAYVDACIKKGFDVDYRRGDTYYYADNAEGYHVSVKYEGFNTMFVRIDKPDDEKEEGSEEKVTETKDDSISESSGQTSEGLSTVETTGIRPEFKEAMDSYEAFFDEYIEFMKNYDENDATMLLKSANILTQYAETMEKMEEKGSEEMNDAEAAYYLEVTTRINQKLLSVA